MESGRDLVRRIVMAIVTTTMASGCGLTLAGLVAHNSHRPCERDPSFAVIDLASGAASAVALAVTGKFEDSKGWIAVPAVLTASGIMQAVWVAKCRRGERDAAPTVTHPVEPMPDRSVPTSLHMRPPETPVDTGSGSDTPQQVTCSITPVVAPCPAGFSCVLVEGNDGYCRVDP